ncbi:hypothetical protein B0F90DRAFT_1182977 [Multifurca ochricompacta]|uniref:Uncharacterized protein n=1 Tax=Multifurca ochricompacta TaxID=376703 RepID=A0AAD4M887_9AGAM|nr:hypothetical protein B0F90DRAFT_1182977 [Multifurca ochricompacta]
MSLSVSSFPEAPPRLVDDFKWQAERPPKDKRRFFSSLFGKGGLPFMKSIGQLGKARVKDNAIRPVNGGSSSSPRRSSLTWTSIKASNTVIDITATHDDDERPSMSRGHDVSTPDPISKLNSSSPQSPPPLPASPPSSATADCSSTAFMQEVVTAPRYRCPLRPIDCVHTPKVTAPLPTRGYEIIPAVSNLEQHSFPSQILDRNNASPMTPPAGPSTLSHATPTYHTSTGSESFPLISSQLRAVPINVGDPRPRFASTGARGAVPGTLPPSRKSEATAGEPSASISPNDSRDRNRKGKGTVFFTAGHPSASQARSYSDVSFERERKDQVFTGDSSQQRQRRDHKAIGERAVLSASGKVVDRTEGSPLLNAHISHMRSGSRPPSNPLLSFRRRPKTAPAMRVTERPLALKSPLFEESLTHHDRILTETTAKSRFHLSSAEPGTSDVSVETQHQHQEQQQQRPVTESSSRSQSTAWRSPAIGLSDRRQPSPSPAPPSNLGLEWSRSIVPHAETPRTSRPGNSKRGGEQRRPQTAPEATSFSRGLQSLPPVVVATGKDAWEERDMGAVRARLRGMRAR